MKAGASLRRVGSCVIAVLLLAGHDGLHHPRRRKRQTLAALSSNKSASQPRMATYNCADGGMITIENLGCIGAHDGSR